MVNNLKVMVFVGKRDTRKKDGTVVKRDVYSVMKLETADFIGVPADLRKSGISQDVEIKAGAAAGATYKRAVKGARGIQFTFHYPDTSTDAAGRKDTTKKVSVGFPSGTPATLVLEFAQKLSNKPIKFNTPSGRMHHLEDV
jgi:hypothetical protein